ncbi:short-chain dehydrogenase TIC 32 [Echria macrotheca]|uniref:Short-chain dehydrogenase TIC 32 n=1 Tax=Echria macrotheca TaxID=438768 RepID=A0AAJ0F4K5_9PEZI|nr:short-chain dehydrogenase TIC 32 [Echria macrotheca]
MTYNAQTGASQLVADLAADIKDKVILITGPSPGSIGAAFAEAVAAGQPALIILATRNPSKVEPVSQSIASAHPSVKVRTLELDLGSLEKVRRATDDVNSWADVPVIDVVVNNAGIMAVPFELSPEGVESQFATNHLGHFLFVNLIMAKILAARAPRVVIVASDAHRLQSIRFGGVNFDDGKVYNKWLAYGQSKTANMLTALALANKLGKRGLLAFSLHPGVILTHLADHLDAQKEFADLHALEVTQGNREAKDEMKFKTPDQGAATSVYAAFYPGLKDHNGAYLQDCQVADPWTQCVRPWGTDPVEAEMLWKLTEELAGQEFSY